MENGYYVFSGNQGALENILREHGLSKAFFFFLGGGGGVGTQGSD